MTTFPVLWLLISRILQTRAAFFHEPSHIVLSPADNHTTDFGITSAYFKESLVVGAPHANLNGAVYTCPIDNITSDNTVTCSNSGIDINRLTYDYDRKIYPNQPFCLGGSISATPTYFITCAPLWAKAVKKLNDESIQGAFGTCFTSTGSYIMRLNGLLEHYEHLRIFKLNKTELPTLDDLYGNFGWTTIVDEINEIILFAKPADYDLSRITYLPIWEPKAFTVNTNLNEPGIKSYKYKGRAFASGNFFKNYNTLNAFSMENDKRIGAIGFLAYNSSTKLLSVVKAHKRSVVFSEGTIGSMFGAVLHATDLTGDQYSDLFVGAPAQSCRDRSFEIGAVHIYESGDQAKDRTISNLCICGNEDGSRFGTAIASADLDEDNIPEIFISAPYEGAGSGTVYIISGYELRETLRIMKSIKKPTIFIKDLRPQVIRNGDYKTFGYSLQVIPSFNHLQLSALGIGSPDSQRVVLYRSIPSVTAVVTAKVAGNKIVRELDDEFVVTIRVDVTYPKTVNVTAKFLVKVRLISNAYAKIKGATEYLIDLTSMETSYINNIVVSLNDHDPHTYKFKAELTTFEEGLQHKGKYLNGFYNVDILENLMENPFQGTNPTNIINAKVSYNSSLVRLSQYSKPEVVLDIRRTCNGDECRPRLSATFHWSGSDDSYVLGSSEKEVLSLVVQNDGNSSDVTCAWVHVSGASVALLECDQLEDWYRCNILTIGRHEQHSINITFDMKRPMSTDSELRVDVMLYNNCPMSIILPDYDIKTKIIPYTLNPDDIQITGLARDQNITQSKIQDEYSSIDVHNYFTIINNGTVLWKSVKARLIAEEQEFLEGFEVYSSDFEACYQDTLSNFTYNCVLDIKPNSIVRIVTTTNFLKAKINDNLKDNKINTTTIFKLTISDKLETKNNTLTTVLIYRDDGSFGENEALVVIAACIISAVILALVIYGLFKIGFFKRKEKKKLQRLKSSFRIPPPPSNDNENIDDDTIRAEENPRIPPPPSNDNENIDDDTIRAEENPTELEI